eukprot:2939318-Pyramimonas_sp.AAC.1
MQSSARGATGGEGPQAPFQTLTDDALDAILSAGMEGPPGSAAGEGGADTNRLRSLVDSSWPNLRS